MLMRKELENCIERNDGAKLEHEFNEKVGKSIRTKNEEGMTNSISNFLQKIREVNR